MKNMKKMLCGLVVLGSIALLAACSDDDPASVAASGNCPAVGTKQCTNDDPVDQADFDGCQKEKNDAKCGSAYVEVLKCSGNNVSCGSDGKVDTSKFLSACATQFQNYTKCKTP